MYRQVTNAIEVLVEPNYLQEQSRPDDGVYVWAYAVQIINRGQHPVQLLNRYWCITDGRGQQLEVRGPGVVGDQPLIKPGAAYTYSSFTNLNTSSGFMVGHYEMENQNGELLQVSIPAFSLDSPDQLALPN